MTSYISSEEMLCIFCMGCAAKIEREIQAQYPFQEAVIWIKEEMALIDSLAAVPKPIFAEESSGDLEVFM